MSLYFRPEKGVLGDVIPFYDNGVFKPFYLRNYRGNRDANHQDSWVMLSTTDHVHFTEHDTKIVGGTGSVIKVDGIYHMFFCTFQVMPEKNYINHAVSTNLDTWTEIPEDRFASDNQIYAPVHWRDPFVFWCEEENCWWMIFAAQKQGMTTRRGCVGLCKSDDLHHWSYCDPIYAPMNAQCAFECPDLFKMGDWWYLVFSEYSEGNKIHYRRSKNLYGPWEAPFDDAFDGRAYYAGRTAFDGERRVLFGWVPTRIDNDDKNAYLWGGTFVPHEVFQKEDGTLGVKPVDQMMEAFDGWKDLFNPCMKTIDTKEETLLCEDTGSIAAFKTTVKFEEGTKEFSIRFYKDEETEVSYEYRFFVEENKVVFNKCPNYPWYQCFNIGLERPIKLEADKEYEICLIIDQDISTLYINGTALNARLCDHPGNGLALTVTDGTLEAKNTKIATKINK